MSEISREKADEAISRGTLYGFVPHALVLEEINADFRHFPYNILFMSWTAKDGKRVSGSALYEPEFSTFKKEGELCCMRYRNVYNTYDSECHVMVAYDCDRKSYFGEKLVRGESAGEASGPDWNTFFIHLTMLGLTAGERCEFDRPIENN